MFTSAAMDARSVDADWFSQHPERATYVRAALPGEIADEDPECAPLVAVRKLTGGDFARAYFPCPDDMTERTARVFALLIDELFERISAKHGGQTVA
ncbi:MAG: hypothetical protein GY844_29955 [Bradyrhizobium sp.]|nr:hypothetical protein [Bradyrhizobium sp.]